MSTVGRVKYQAQGKRREGIESRLPSPGQRLLQTALKGEVLIDMLAESLVMFI